MVHVAHPHAFHQDADWRRWLDAIAPSYGEDEGAMLRRACEFASSSFAPGGSAADEGALAHALGTAGIVSGLKLNAEAVAAAILHAVPISPDTAPAALSIQFGPAIANLVDGVTRMGQIHALADTHEAQSAKGEQIQLESLRKMLLAMVDDIRVVLIKLAERTQALRDAAGKDAETQRRVAREVQEIYAPLANRLGVWQIKWEMEDLAFRYLEPEAYKTIARLLEERRVDRERYIADVLARLRDELAAAGLRAEVAGRPKHIYSIYRKMRRKGVDFGELYDVRAVRVLVEKVADCYTALGIVHNLWRPIPKEFDDYISHPKGNFYRSLHTAVIGPDERALEVQIRTYDMHQDSELGVAAHWRYKEGGRQDARFEEKIAWLRQVLEWKEDMPDSGELAAQFKEGLFVDTVYVLTPQGKVVALPQGATPIDFAYHVHTDLGHRCRGAKVNGNIVPLNYRLKNGQQVEILSAKQGGPSRDWLSADYVASQRVRARIRHWFKYQYFDEQVSHGRDQLERELQRLGIGEVNQEKLAQALSFARTEDMLAALGRGDVPARALIASIRAGAPRLPEPEALQAQPHRLGLGRAGEGILIGGVGNLLVNLARCCKPVFPEPIVGFVTRGRGVTVHRRDCTNMRHLPENRRERLVAAEWGRLSGAPSATDVEIEAHDRQGLLLDITAVLNKEKVHVLAAQTQTRSGLARLRLTLEIADLGQLGRVLGMLREVPGVAEVRRGE
ncbi:MAG: bifunctional (p)ppGpp synthetase/guanosine-3',5'-bis(diphosphate) 3'-pyrophosphohydrolase [Sulfuricellaceae bacterium]|nr:bifunctional (p)ppGpp synthetase/guanosine-3',5'-bis(diphosphate) 3'-pyrophosphohydrolase [Sulfuricellaceae bacterium]